MLYVCMNFWFQKEGTGPLKEPAWLLALSNISDKPASESLEITNYSQV